MAHIRDLDSFLEECRNHERGIEKQEYRYYWWIPLDRPILRACKGHPGHSDCSEVYAKVALVNRMYSANLGRYNKEGKFEAEDQVAQALFKSDIDKFIKPLLDLDALSEDVLPKVLKCHDRLIQIARPGAGNEALSFCSKYLSFHLPRVVPILDRRAELTASQVEGIPSFRGCGRFEKHCRRVLALMNFLVMKRIMPNLKIIDYVLYSDPAT